MARAGLVREALPGQTPCLCLAGLQARPWEDLDSNPGGDVPRWNSRRDQVPANRTVRLAESCIPILSCELSPGSLPQAVQAQAVGSSAPIRGSS